MTDAPKRNPRGWRAVVAAMRSWRTASVALMSFSSGLPLGLVYVAIPDWMHSIGVDLRVVGLITLAQVPWSFKVLWSPLMDRFVPPFLGRRRGWAVIAQVALFALTLWLAGVGRHPDSAWVVAALALGIAFASATQDIAVDAYAVDVLRPDEQGVAVGFRTAMYLTAMRLAGAFAITFAAWISWPVVLTCLSLVFLVMVVVTRAAPKPDETHAPPRSLREAVWQPFVGFLSKPRALEILAFVMLYKLSDVLANALLRPFLIDRGYDEIARGAFLGAVSWGCNAGGALLGGLLTTGLGVGRALWIFGVIQALANVGYVLVATMPTNTPLMLAATGFETLASGMGTGAFSVLLLRLTQKRFSATQYALMSSLFALPRIVGGPITGFTVDAIGWPAFFWVAIAAGIPGLALLSRFAPWSVRDPGFDVPAERVAGVPLSGRALAARGLAGGIVATVGGVLITAILAALKAMRGKPDVGFDLAGPLGRLVPPADVASWVQLGGILVFGVACALLTAAVAAARRGAFSSEAERT